MSEAPGAQTEKPSQIHIRIGLPDGTICELDVEPTTPLSDVASRILETQNLVASSVRARLITAGRVCDPSQLAGDVLPEGGFLHCALSDAPPPQPEESEPSVPRNATQIVVDATSDSGEVRIYMSDVRTDSTYERLVRAGLTPEELRIFTRYFRTSHIDESETDDDAREAELRGTAQELNILAFTRRRRNDHHALIFSSSHEGTNADFLMGCIFGYLLGLIVLVLLLDKNATRRWRVGILAGIATNCAFGILRSSLYLNASFPPA